ncbi:MAG: hypothetical protein PHS66_01520 [Candidatus Omnitrophica bacterium]|nr:hypothetical protein [Candidatus Omnitrophota bacterium]
MDFGGILKKLQDLYNIEEVEKGFPSQQACIDWSNKVAPLLKFNEQYYYNFIQNAHKINLPLSSYTLKPAFNIMKSQVQMAIEELKLEKESGKENATKPKQKSVDSEKVFINACGPLAKDACDLNNEITQEFNENNVFLDIPYQKYEDCESALKEILTKFGLIPIIAKDKLTSEAVLCKVCKLIKTCKYGIVDISSASNSVSYEYGLMHGLGIKVCLLLRPEVEKFTDIDGLEHLSYGGLRNFKLTVAKWLLDNVTEISKEKVRKFIKSEEEELSRKGDIVLKKINSDPEAKVTRNYLAALDGDLKEYYQLLFIGVNNYLYADSHWVLLNYKDFNTANKHAMWPELIKLEVFYTNQVIFNRINKIFSKIEDLNEKMKTLNPYRDNLNSSSIDVQNYRSLMNEIKNLYILPKGESISYEESIIGEFFANSLKSLTLAK